MRCLIPYSTLLVCIIFITNISTLHSFHIDNLQATRNKIAPSQECSVSTLGCFSEIDPCLSKNIVVCPLALQQAAKDSLRYIKHKKKLPPSALEPSSLKNIMDKTDVTKTLRFIIKTIEEDKATGNYRILDPNFINANFKVIKWVADKKNAHLNNVKLPQNGEIKLTNYVVYNVKGSRIKTPKYNCALYKLLNEPLRTKFSKHQILYGALEKPPYHKKVAPLAWLTRDDFEQALLQGTVLVSFSNKSYKIFTVSSNNNVDFNKTIKDIKKQKRYWFFKEAKSSLASVDEFKKRIQSRKEVVFAGDIYNIGIGKLIAIQHVNQLTQKQEMYLGILADTGGAFVNNLYQLDFFAGMFNNAQGLKKYVKKFPFTTQAYLLCKK